MPAGSLRYATAAYLAALILVGAAGVAVAQQGALPPPAYLAAQAATASWPHTLTRDDASVTVYQPQAITWPDRRTLTARAAVAILPKGHDKPILGTIEISLATRTDEAAGLVHLSDPTLLGTHFPALDTQQATALEEKIRTVLPDMQTHQVPLSAVLLSLKQSPVSPVAVKNDPPVIFASSRPASLVVFDGDPVLAPIGKTGLSFAVNTNWDVFVDAGTWYLLNNGLWLSAPAAAGLDGPWEFATDKLPPDFALIPPDGHNAGVLAAVPGTVAAQEAVLQAQIPTTATLKRGAAKLTVVYAGAPRFVPVPGTTILHAVNTDTVVLRIGERYYACANGAWFVAASPTGLWLLADSVPPEIGRIPPSSPLYNVTYVQVYAATPTAVTYGRQQRRRGEGRQRRRLCRPRRQRLSAQRQRLVEMEQRRLEPGAAAIAHQQQQRQYRRHPVAGQPEPRHGGQQQLSATRARPARTTVRPGPV